MFEIHFRSGESGPTFELEGELTIYAVSEARRELEALQGEHPRLVLDLQNVQEIDSAGVQLLLWLKRRAAMAGHDFAIAQASQAVVEVLDLLQVAGEFGGLVLPVPPGA